MGEHFRELFNLPGDITVEVQSDPPTARYRATGEDGKGVGLNYKMTQSDRPTLGESQRNYDSLVPPFRRVNCCKSPQSC